MVNVNGIPYVNGKLYDWADIVVTIAGVPVTGITGIEYKEKILSNKDKLGYASLITDNTALYEPKGKNETKSSKGNKGDKK